MRPIKFRAYDPVRKMMFYFGRTSDNEQMHTEDNQCSFDVEFRGIIFHSMYDADNDALYELDYDSRQLMQFTGLYDKHGKEIYEGDIVRTPKGDLRKIVYDFNSFKTVPLDENYKDDTVWYYDIEVIGNIYENKQ